MSFVLRILFSGLMALVPSPDGKEVTVLLLNANHHHLSDGTELQCHKPVLVARAGSCSGDCPTRDANVAQAIFVDKTPAQAGDALETAVAGGAAWDLTGSEITLSKSGPNAANLPPLVFRNDARGYANGQPLPIPTTATEREDYSWIANLKQLCPDCTINPDVMAAQPPAIVAARLRLRSGKVFTYSVARIGSDVTPVHFKRLDGTGGVSTYSQAIATWVGADIQVDGDSIEIVDQKFNGDPGRSMTLSPDADGKVEMAVLNLPPFVPPATPSTATPEVGRHYEVYYDISATPPAAATRLVPFAGAASTVGSYPQVDWQSIHPTATLYSELLNQLRLNIGRTAYDRTLCPPTTDPWP